MCRSVTLALVGLDNLYPSVTLIFQAVGFKHAVNRAKCNQLLLSLFITGFRGTPPFPCDSQHPRIPSPFTQSHRPINQPASYTSTPLHTLHQVIGLKAGLSGTGTQDVNHLHMVVFKKATVVGISDAFPSEN